MVWQGILTGWHWLVSFMGSVLLWSFLAAIVLFVVERFIYRAKTRREEES